MYRQRHLEITNVGKKRDLVVLVIVVAVALWIAAIAGPIRRKRLAKENLATCEGNLKLIADACERYSTDHAGKYPHVLRSLVPTYLKELPRCPSAGTGSYSEGYYNMTPRTYVDQFSVWCRGHHHKTAGMPPNFPQQSSQGVVLPPELSSPTPTPDENKIQP
jgi:hypothetical protein